MTPVKHIRVGEGFYKNYNLLGLIRKDLDVIPAQRQIEAGKGLNKDTP